MSNLSLKKQLALVRRQLRKKKQQQKGDSDHLRVALVGIGSELNGDDAAGIEVARMLNSASALPADFIAIDGGPIPENTSGPLRKFSPDLVILVDAADLGKPAGSVEWLEADMIDGMSASSHTLPLSVLGKYLEAELRCQVAYLGIQPAQLDFAAPLTIEVKRSVDLIVSIIREEFQILIG